jgi:regulator of protease activity HflC (stomatin/prohibitin superfamily)
MKTRFALIFLLLVMLGLTACEKVPAGHVGVKVYLLGGEKGVDSEELSPGRYYIGWNKDLFLFPTFTQNYVWTRSTTEGSETNESLTFQTIEGLSVNADVGISYHIDPERVSLVFQKYRKGVDEITDIFLRNMVRDALVNAASVKQIEMVYGSGKTDLLKEVEDAVTAECDPIGIIVEKISFIGDFRLPDSVRRAINSKIEATQKAQQRQNEVAEAIAAANKLREQAKGQADAILTRAKAEAEANLIVAQSITDTLVQYRSVTRWNGALPAVTGGAIPMVPIPGLVTVE